MIKYFNTLLTSTNSNNVVLKYLITIAMGYAVYSTYKSSNKNSTRYEGFYQREQFVLKRNEEIYDSFYAEIYDNLHDTKKRSQWELMKLLKHTEMDTRNSVILDVGSGTGYTVNELTSAGYKAFGIEKSKDMVAYSETKYPNIEVVCEDVEDTLAFERDAFTHILCTNFTLYHIKNKELFFRNCYGWMKPNGYLVLHLVDRKRFNVTARKFGDEIEWKSFYDKPKQRVTNQITNFDDFKYTAGFNFPVNLDETNIVTKTETFKDKETAHVRQNEQILYMEDIRQILNIANACGFIFHAKVDMNECIGDDNQYLYILERPQ